MRPRIARADVCGAIVSSIAVVLFSLILLWRDPWAFWIDDYQISVLPVFADVARSWSEGHWPVLSPYSWVCNNLAGEFQYGTFSLFINAAVVVIWRILHGFAHQAAALSILHLVVLATGGFVLARQRNLSPPLAMLVSLIAALNGWIIGWGAPDWFGALGAFAWLPWAWWGLEKALASNVALAARQCSETDHRPALKKVRQQAVDATASSWRFLWPAPFVYLVATGGFPYTIVMLGLLIAWLTLRSVVQTRSFFAPLPMLLGVALGFGLAAPALLALLAYVHGSAREAQPASAHWQWIVPPAALPGLIVPSWTVDWIDFSTRYRPHTGTELACGLVPPAAVLWGVLFRTRAVIRRLRWDLALLGIVLVIAMLPTAGLFRWSFRWLPFFHLILALCVAECLALLGQENNGSRQSLGRLSPAILAIALVSITAMAMKFFHTGGTYFLPLTAILLAIAVVWAGAEYLLMESRAPASPIRTSAADFTASQARRPPSAAFDLRSAIRSYMPAMVIFGSLLATYLCIPPNAGVPRFNFIESLMDPAPLDPARLYLSVYPLAELAYRKESWPQSIGQIVRPGSTSMWAKLRFINGYSPIRPAGVAKQFVSYIHGDIDPDSARRLLSQQAGPGGALAELGVDGITIAREMDFNPEPANEWELVTSANEGRVFHRRGQPFARVRSVTSLSSRPNEQFIGARISHIQEFRNQVEADIEVPEGANPALITFSRPYFEGYQASLGEKKLNVSSERGLFPVVELPGGSQGRLVLNYRPQWLIQGGAIAIVCLAFWLTCAVIALCRPKLNR